MSESPQEYSHVAFSTAQSRRSIVAVESPWPLHAVVPKSSENSQKKAQWPILNNPTYAMLHKAIAVGAALCSRKTALRSDAPNRVS